MQVWHIHFISNGFLYLPVHYNFGLIIHVHTYMNVCTYVCIYICSFQLPLINNFADLNHSRRFFPFNLSEVAIRWVVSFWDLVRRVGDFVCFRHINDEEEDTRSLTEKKVWTWGSLRKGYEGQKFAGNSDEGLKELQEIVNEAMVVTIKRG